MASNTYVALATQTLGTSAASVTLSSIPAGYTDLVLVANYTTTVANLDVRVQVNGDTSTNYSYTYIQGQGTGAGSGRGSNTTYLPYYFAVGTSTNGNMQIFNFQNYSNTTTYKNVLARMSSAEKELNAHIGMWRSTAAINSITLFTNTNAFAAGSTFTIYGVLTASAGLAKATGGTIYYGADGYIYHKFTGNGTFTPTTSLTADILCVGGGGGGGRGGGAGAGGVIGFTSQALTATGYAVTIGGGGATNTVINAPGANGTNTTFAALTAAVGGGGGGGFSNSSQGAGVSGGSGGGGGGSDSTPNAGGSGTSGQGYAGGNGSAVSTNNAGGGGGGAGAAGANASGATAGAGGVGTTTYSQWGYVTSSGQNVSGTYYFAGGGGGIGSSAGAAGGYGGGGTGGTYASSAGVSGTVNTGGGASGATSGTANGGSGIVIVRYLG